ncbi:UTRA domain-containing protein [Pediococcus pentosaceus]|nr:UTRA domain-containing protein [Pediococcus pentosaceus]
MIDQAIFSPSRSLSVAIIIVLATPEKELNVTMPSSEQMNELQISSNEPLFSVNETTFNQKDQPIEYSHLLVRGDKMTYTIEAGQSYFKMNG